MVLFVENSKETRLMKALLIDDDLNLCKVLSYQLQKNGFEVITANNGADGLEIFKKNPADVVITDVQMPGMSGIDVLQQIRQIDRQVIVIVITAYGSIDNALKACRIGADDYLTKPFSQEQLLFVIEKAIRFRNLQSENQQLRQEVIDKHQFGNLIARSSPMEEVIKMAARVAMSDSTVLILGESGTGKELLARAIHYNSPRKDKPFVTVNCPSIPDNLLESELFGHVKGAFTGALKDRKGKFELAHGGTIFLDEIGDLQENLQAKLLRVLQEREFEPVGGSKAIRVDVRVIAATNKNLENLMQEGKFREDLYYRLSVVPITMPPLRDRKEEIPYLVDLFVQRYGKGRQFEVDPEVYKVLQKYDWPGNVRELENAIERAVVLSADNRITVNSLPPTLGRSSSTQTGETTGEFWSEEDISLDRVERKAISEALRRSGGNRSEAARILKIPRHVLLYRMKKLGLE